MTKLNRQTCHYLSLYYICLSFPVFVIKQPTQKTRKRRGRRRSLLLLSGLRLLQRVPPTMKRWPRPSQRSRVSLPLQSPPNHWPKMRLVSQTTSRTQQKKKQKRTWVYCIVLYLYIYIALLAVHTNHKHFRCERPREKRAVLRERKEALGSPVMLFWFIAICFSQKWLWEIRHARI